MEEGTGISLYILVGSIMFGLFAVMVSTFGTDLHAQTSNIVTCVQSYVLDGPTDCGGSESDDLGETITPNNIRYGPTSNEWYEMDEEQRELIKEQFIQQLAQEIPDITSTTYYDWASRNGFDNTRGYIYGVYNDDGQLIKTYSMGHTTKSDYQDSKYIRVNDIRLVPEIVQQKAERSVTNSGSDVYLYTDERGVVYEYLLMKA